ncbi:MULTISPECIES: AraC family transcriptional regulator [unclassified Rhizobium]|uniref:AraC family transcriptional regulator n=1 Tax=unclassified Rhizobium TaxID=2613769 RepID=UPI000B532CE1|nr:MULTISPECIES: AraC family transcriptional regulator [unclassified Rhizobium]
MTDCPDFEPSFDRSSIQDDALSHLLAWVQLRGETVYQAELHDPWRLRFPPGASHVHLVIEGAFDLRLLDGTTIRLEAGDLALVPHGSGHAISSQEAGSAAPVDAFTPDMFDASRLLLWNRGEGRVTRIVGGLFRYERQPLPPVLKALPPVIHLRPSDHTVPDWRSVVASFLIEEANHPAPGTALMISRIIDLMVIRTLRSWTEDQPDNLAWLGGAREKRMGRALSAIHEQPTRSWSVEELAGLAGMSRSVFAERFARAFGEPPLRYLMRWRFSIATDLLTQSDLPVGEIARAVGYESEAGFSRAFKAFHGRAPSVVRSEHVHR